LRRYNSRNKLEQLSKYVNEAERQAQIGAVSNIDDITKSD
jgi:hypothetical protein